MRVKVPHYYAYLNKEDLIMMQALTALRLFCRKREEYESHSGFIKGIDNLDRHVYVLFSAIQRYYEKYKDHNYIEKDELKKFYDYLHPQNRDKDVHHELIDTMFEEAVSNSVARDIFEQVVEQSYAARMIARLAPVVQGHKSNVVPLIASDVEEFIGFMKNPPSEAKVMTPCSLSVEELVAQEILEEGVPWHLENLNEIIGGVRRRTLGAIYAFVDSGKTSFGLSACASFARALKDTGDTILYAGNEEAAPRLSLRLTQAMLGVTRADLKLTPAEIDERRREVGYTRVKIFDNVIHASEVHRLLEQWAPRIVFIDQGTKVSINSKLKEVEEQQELFNFYREAAKDYNTSIISLMQGVGDAENRKWLKLSDIYGSRVAIQGELDYAIGIGRRIDDAARENYRYINIPKNKLMEGETGKFMTLFTKESCQWRAI
jgi:replicative DNA helicase